MSLPHFFLPDQVIADESEPVFIVRFAADDEKHLRALRLEPGEHLALIDSAHDYFECELTQVNRACIKARIAQKLDAPQRPSLMLFQGIAKGEKMDRVLRAATEIGIDCFVPLVCSRSVVKLDKKKAASRKARWDTIAKSAAMQAGRYSIPHIENPCDVAGAGRLLARCNTVLVCWEEAPRLSTMRQAIERGLEVGGLTPEKARVAVVVGPEGGLTKQEAEALLASNQGASLVSLGPSILRTETAGIVACALAMYELESRA